MATAGWGNTFVGVLAALTGPVVYAAPQAPPAIVQRRDLRPIPQKGVLRGPLEPEVEAHVVALGPAAEP